MSALKRQLSYEHQVDAIKQAAQKAIERPTEQLTQPAKQVDPGPARVLQDKLRAEYAKDAPFVAHRERWVQTACALAIFMAFWALGRLLYGAL